MGKTGSGCCLTAVKRAFRSPTKETPKKSCKRTQENGQVDEQEEKTTEKQKWISRKLTSHTPQREADVTGDRDSTNPVVSTEEQRRAIAAAEASTAAAKAAVATAQAAVKSVHQNPPANLVRQHYAALLIQTTFRGYLARRALRALKGIVKLQSLVRGHNVRKQAKTTLECMQALIRMQAKMDDQSSRLSHDGTRKSMFAESTNLWDKYKDIRRRKSTFNDGKSNTEAWDQPYTIEDLEAVLQSRKEAALDREKSLAQALSQQIWRFDRNESAGAYEKEATENNERLNQWMEPTQYWENDKYRLINNQRQESIKLIDMESLQPHLKTPTNYQRSQHHQDGQNRRHSLHIASPGLNKARYSLSHQSPRSSTSPAAASLHNTRPLQVRSASPRCCSKGYCRSHSTTSTPALRSNSLPSTVSSNRYSNRTAGATPRTPNYMAATESAKARARTTQSTPRQRYSYSDRDRERSGACSVKKRLSYPISAETQDDSSIYTDYSCFSQNFKSPSFRSVQGATYGLERGAPCSCYTERHVGGELSPASTSLIRTWLG